MEFPEPQKAAEVEPEPEVKKPVLTIKKEESDDETVAQGGFAALLQVRILEVIGLIRYYEGKKVRGTFKYTRRSMLYG